MDERLETTQSEPMTGAAATSSGSEEREAPSGMNMRSSIKSIARSIVINGAVPLVIYNVLKGHGASDITALGIAAVAPAIDGIVTVARARRIDLLSALALIGIAIGIGAVLIGGDPRLLLIRESFLTCALGIACFVSFLLPRPLMFYFGRYFSTGDVPEKVAAYNQLWQYPYFRHVNRIITLVWGFAYVGEFVLRVFMVYRLSINEVLALSPIVFNGITIAVIAWTFAYARFAWRKGTRVQEEAERAAAPGA